MHTHMLIHNQEVKADTYREVHDPGRLNEVVGYVANGTTEDANQAVEAAHETFNEWRSIPLEDRIQLVRKAAAAIDDQKDEIAKITARENGILFQRTYEEIKLSLMDLLYLLDVAEKELKTENYQDESGWVRVEKKPMGVITCIVPWNAPLVLTLQKVIPALLAGNTVVVKPSPSACMGVTFLMKIISEFLPPGTLNVVLGDGDVGNALTTHPKVRKISFTGGGPVASQVMKNAAETLKNVHFELGGNDPAIVLQDVDIDQAVPKIVEAAFRRTGQFCFAIKRVYISESIYQECFEKVCELTDLYKIGHQLNPDVTMGPINNKNQYEKLKDMTKKLENTGGNVVSLGEKLEPDDWDNGYYLHPVVVGDIEANADIVTSEQFGPILPLVPYKTEEEVIRMANATEFGLGSSVWSKNEEHALSVAQRIEAGMTFINGHGPNALGSKYMPFGGVKQSGIGIEKTRKVFDEFTEFHSINFHHTK